MPKGSADPFVERVREATDIVELIGAQVQLKKMGARLAGLCPFHREKTPSFYVNPSMQAFHCFGCGAGGDVFSFLMQHEKMTFPEALRFLAERAGIPLPERRGPSTDSMQRIREALALAREWYRGQLAGGGGSGAREYLDGRGIGPAMREAYGLGFAPDQWDGLLRHGRALLSERVLIEAGLAIESSGGRIYDRFRHRLMVPIETSGGSPVGFGGRALGDQEPKYLNSPETPVYRKGSVLFGVSAAREGIRAQGRVVVVEGYFDVIALVQAGIAGVVGTCGTALTPEQSALLKRLGGKVVLLFDGDAAGRAATLRALPILAGEVSELLVLSPPAGKDPDLWVREAGPDAVLRALDGARGPLAYLEGLMEQGTQTRREAAARAAEVIARVADPLARDLWIQEASSRFGISAEAFGQAVRQRQGEQRRGDQRYGDQRPGERSTPVEPGVSGKADAPAPAWSPLARLSLRSALAEPGRAREIAQALETHEVEPGTLPRILHWIAERAEEQGPVEGAAILSQAIRELPEGGALTALSLAEGEPAETADVVLLKIEQQHLESRIQAVQHEIRKADEAGNLEELQRFQDQNIRLARERARVNKELHGEGKRVGGKDL